MSNPAINSNSLAIYTDATYLQSPIDCLVPSYKKQNVLTDRTNKTVTGLGLLSYLGF